MKIAIHGNTDMPPKLASVEESTLLANAEVRAEITRQWVILGGTVQRNTVIDWRYQQTTKPISSVYSEETRIVSGIDRVQFDSSIHWPKLWKVLVQAAKPRDKPRQLLFVEKGVHGGW